MVSDDTEVPNGIELKDFPGGQYAVMRQTITELSQYAKAWDDLMSMSYESGIETEDRPWLSLPQLMIHKLSIQTLKFRTAIK